MAWKDIPGKQYWQFKDDPELKVLDYLSRATSRRNPTITNNGVRTLPNGRQVYVQTRYVGPGSTDTDTTNRGEIDVNFHLASIGNAGVKPASFFSDLPAVGGGGGGAGINPDFANVSLLLKTSSGSPVDATGNFTSIAMLDGAVVNSSRTKFQANSFNYTGGGYTRITWPNANDKSLFEFGTGPFTIECWVYRTGLGTVGGNGPPLRDAVFSTFRSGDSGFAFFIRQDTGRFEWKTDQGTFLLGTEVVPLNQWSHLAVSRDASQQLKGFVNGVVAFDVAWNSNEGPAGSGESFFYIAKQDTPDTNKRFNGYVEDIRVTKGEGIYTEAFTPPTAEFPTS